MRKRDLENKPPEIEGIIFSSRPSTAQEKAEADAAWLRVLQACHEREEHKRAAIKEDPT